MELRWETFRVRFPMAWGWDNLHPALWVEYTNEEDSIRTFCFCYFRTVSELHLEPSWLSRAAHSVLATTAGTRAHILANSCLLFCSPGSFAPPSRMNIFSSTHLHTELVLQPECSSTEVSFKCHWWPKLDIGVEGVMWGVFMLWE